MGEGVGIVQATLFYHQQPHGPGEGAFWGQSVSVAAVLKHQKSIYIKQS